MAKLVWDAQGEHFFETGVDHGVLFVLKNDGTYDKGVVWNGLTNVAENPDGADETEIYADNIKYLGIRAAENFGFTINCYSHPREFYACDGGAEPVQGVVITQQTRTPFGFSYRTLVGNDTQGQNYGYKIHLVWNATTSPSSKDNNTVNDTPEADEMSYECSTTPVAVGTINGVTYKNTAHMIIDSTKVDSDQLAAFEAVLYGDASNDARLMSPAEVINFFASGAILAGITLNSHSISLRVGGTAELVATTVPAGETVTWTTGNSSVADVANGAVSGEGVGNTIITASATIEGVTYTDTCTAIVTAAS